jgi:hypothetical protein
MFAMSSTVFDGRMGESTEAHVSGAGESPA